MPKSSPCKSKGPCTFCEFLCIEQQAEEKESQVLRVQFSFIQTTVYLCFPRVREVEPPGTAGSAYYSRRLEAHVQRSRDKRISSPRNQPQYPKCLPGSHDVCPPVT